MRGLFLSWKKNTGAYSLEQYFAGFFLTDLIFVILNFSLENGEWIWHGTIRVFHLKKAGIFFLHFFDCCLKVFPTLRLCSLNFFEVTSDIVQCMSVYFHLNSIPRLGGLCKGIISFLVHLRTMRDENDADDRLIDAEDDAPVAHAETAISSHGKIKRGVRGSPARPFFF